MAFVSCGENKSESLKFFPPPFFSFPRRNPNEIPAGARGTGEGGVAEIIW